MQCSAPAAPIRSAARDDAELQDQLLFGEMFDVLEENDGWAWGQARRDGYVGWTPVEALSSPVLAPTHAVSALRTYAFAEPDFKAATVGLYSLNALVSVEAQEGRFLRCARSGWFAETHLREVGGGLEADPLTVAKRFLAAPYQWGGRESLGLDCSALVQQALYACGRACPRDADMQEDALGREIGRDRLAPGDLAFWNGHVAWMLDGEHVLHATAHRMEVCIEPIADVVARFGSEPTSCRRL
jgi:cell wall-associated NlpC family hydrolase